jgi:hypothetical protein
MPAGAWTGLRTATMAPTKRGGTPRWLHGLLANRGRSFNVTVVSAQTDPAMSIALPPAVEAGVPAAITIVLRDQFGNRRRGGSGFDPLRPWLGPDIASAALVRRDVPGGAGAVSVTTLNRGDGTLTASFTPTTTGRFQCDMSLQLGAGRQRVLPSPAWCAAGAHQRGALSGGALCGAGAGGSSDAHRGRAGAVLGAGSGQVRKHSRRQQRRVCGGALSFFRRERRGRWLQRGAVSVCGRCGGGTPPHAAGHRAAEAVLAAVYSLLGGWLHRGAHTGRAAAGGRVGVPHVCARGGG